MTPFEIDRLGFSKPAVSTWAQLSKRHTNWPVVYVLDGKKPVARSGGLKDVYVGESLNAANRLRQHFDSDDKKHLSEIRVIVDETFNKSVCLDLESFLIRMLAGDGAFSVLNRNDGITDADYYDRARYRETFRDVFEELRADGVFTRTIPEIENSDLFKLSPFKALSTDQAVAVEGILEGLFGDLESQAGGTIVIQGDPGTGKTIVAIFLLKILVDISRATDSEDSDGDTMFAEFFSSGYRELLENLTIGLVIPQQSLRNSIKKVFRKTPGLSVDMVMSPFEVGKSDTYFDVLIVDEAHRLSQRANQPSATQNASFRDITVTLFGVDDSTKTQLDWVRAKSRHQILLVDSEQSVRPADLPREVLSLEVVAARASNRHYRLANQMRVAAGSDYVAYIRQLLSPDGVMFPPQSFVGYDLRMFDSVGEMRSQIRLRDEQYGLARMVAGFAWKWVSRRKPELFDIDVDGEQLRWNSTDKDWIASPGAIDEVGSIHTVQGYDLNYAGVIIGPDLRLDSATGRLGFDRANYFDKKGMEGNRRLGRTYGDADLLRFVTNIYAVLLTRGIRGTYVYVSDPVLREHLRQFLSSAA